MAVEVDKEQENQRPLLGNIEAHLLSIFLLF